MTENKATAAREAFALGMTIGTGSLERKSFRQILAPNLAGLIAVLLLPLIAVGMPWQGWALAVVAWLINRVAHIVTLHFTNHLPVTMAVGATGIAMMFRVWLIAAAFFIVGMVGTKSWALWGIGLFLVMMTIDICVRVFSELSRRAEAGLDSPVVDTPVEEPVT